jgi:predicted membrane protein (TIGR00267 family)
LPSEKGPLSRIRSALRTPDTGPAMRRFFINTVFDSTFVVLGVIIGSAFSPEPRLSVVITTILTSSLALGISTGVSVHEAESMEQSRRIERMERALLTSLDDTEIRRLSRISLGIISFTSLIAPIAVCVITISPFLLVAETQIRTAAWVSVILAIGILFSTGAMMGRMGKRNPWARGTRMAIAGLAAFAICFWVQTLV